MIPWTLQDEELWIFLRRETILVRRTALLRLKRRLIFDPLDRVSMEGTDGRN
jgi:hypothetical protein